jgi:hypothetical protein
MIVVPVTHDLIHSATVDTAHLPLSLLDEVAEERGAGRKRHMVDVAVQGLVHSEHESGHTIPFLTRHIRAVLIALCNRLQGTARKTGSSFA